MTIVAQSRSDRRGALLLIVLGVLSLFMLAGTVMLTLTSRARSTSRAFAEATSGSTIGPMRARAQLREAIMRVLRGHPKGTDYTGNVESVLTDANRQAFELEKPVSSKTPVRTFYSMPRARKAFGMVGESLLEDMHGSQPPLKGRVTAAFDHWPLLLVVVETDEPMPSAAALGGSVLTFKPDSGSGRATKSYRMLRVSTDGAANRFTCWLDQSQNDPADALVWVSVEAEGENASEMPAGDHLGPGFVSGFGQFGQALSLSLPAAPGRYRLTCRYRNQSSENFGLVDPIDVSLDAEPVSPPESGLPVSGRFFLTRNLGDWDLAAVRSEANPYRVSIGGNGDFELDAVSLTQPCDVLINRQAFRDEPYDAFDDENPGLTELSLMDGTVVSVPRAAWQRELEWLFEEFDSGRDDDAYETKNGVHVDEIRDRETAGPEDKWHLEMTRLRAWLQARGFARPDERIREFDSDGNGGISREEFLALRVDNDNDGVADGVWLPGLLEHLPNPEGGQYEFDVSYLVVDLDSRINVNAHGSLTSLAHPAASGDWRNAPDVPSGSGYGPADVNASLLFLDPDQAAIDPPPVSDHWRRIVGAQAQGDVTAVASSDLQRRPVARVGAIAGRYGTPAEPGITGSPDPEKNNDVWSAMNETVYDGNVLVDLKGMLKTDVEMPKNSSEPMPHAVYFSPDWSTPNFIDDPYEMRLDDAAARPMALRGDAQPTADNPFTLAELEAVLRQFDADAPTLPPRLSVALDNLSQRSRLQLTTDSWDTPALTGSVAGEIEEYLKTLQCDPAGVMSPDVLAGLRFDINRPFPAGADELAAKREYCKHLYMLLVALGQPADATSAQWAANVVDYRDPDSTFTRFQFDSDPADGWGEGTAGWDPANVVWGIERPELVIAQTVAFYVQDNTDGATVQDALYVSLYRPSWTEELRDGSGVFETRTAAPINLAEKSSQSSQPVWRLRIEPGTTVRFDKPGSGEKEIQGVFRKTGGGNGDATIGPDEYLVVMPTPQKSTGKKSFDTAAVEVPVDRNFTKFEINSGGTFKADHWPGAASYQSGADSMVFLERLEDPAKPWNDDPTSAAYNPYVVLDRLGIKRVNRTGEGANNWKTFIREHLIWNNGPFETVGSAAGIVPLDPSIKSWLPWANRAYISHAELLLVPQGGGAWRFWDYTIPKKRKEQGVKPFYELPTSKLLEATIVPSRFAGSQVSVDPGLLKPVGMDMIPFNQLSRWREPGRVNLNTVVPNRPADPATQTQLDDAIWRAVMGTDAAVSLDEYRDPGSVPDNTAPGQWPAKNLTEMLTLLQGPNVYVDTQLGDAEKASRGKSWKKNRLYDENPAAAYTTAIRLANVATIRSHLFAVWVTIRMRDWSPGGKTTYHRAFAIIDRSRPVGFSEGEDLNVSDAIRVLRFLE